MAFKFVVFAAFVAVAQAGVISSPYHGYAAPAVAAYAKVATPLSYAAPVAKVAVAEEYDPHPQYSYAYDIQDALTGDSKSQHESRDGDVVHGSYSLIDADGFKRTVEYTADPIHGFNAVVHREPLGVKAVAKIAAPVAYAPAAYAAPVAKLGYAAPVAKVAYAAPVAHYAAPVAYAPVAKVAAPLAYAAPAQQYYHH